MKGEEYSVQTIIFLVASVFAVLVLITLANSFIYVDNGKEVELKGDKDDIVLDLKKYIYDCAEQNKGSHDTVLCFKIFANFTGTITKAEMILRLDPIRIESGDLDMEDITGPAYIIVSYALDKVIIENRYYG
ncbi:MAG: hypothetical protein DRP06_03360 [Candidatus Aenigmatarchaeota archaeon]|nr:MAG: hypothetical protein DRP06_03360 [Candidatus Aenigmarchaeota archaeon]